ncbi:S1/P1 nuclease [Ochrovirga pacifica]|uniref:S1/P1 nuclease n=1 Tax=Ochrovirga pacifica TaxID=1042376 RepID=UPI00025594DC|nr:S1/P1 nuclease [Ochrovirga pacifica]
MKKITFVFLIITLHLQANNDWGKTGHRTVGEVANSHISKKTAKKVAYLLEGRSLAFVSIYADEIRSDGRYNEFAPWHYVNFEGDKKYKEDPVNPKGDILQGIKTCILKIRNPIISKEDKTFYLKMLVHFVGDLHMPLHAGNKHDYGGNKIKVQWYGKDVNLHSLWDTHMLDSYQMSYSELANNTDVLKKKELRRLQSGSLLDWVHESRKLALKVYKEVEDGERLGYKYMYHNFPIVRTQLQKGGVRLAKVLDETFKKKSTWLDAFLAGI